MVSAPAVTGSIFGGNSFKMRSKTSRVLGSPAHIFTGMCAFQNLITNSSGQFMFQDGTGNVSNLVYMNPRICCQNSGYGVPAGLCPIGVIAQPFRKYSFRKLVIHYQPTNASTALSGTIAFAYDPEVITTSSLGPTPMAYANFEASAYGPMWTSLKLDVTKWLDRSKWFYGETSSTLATSLIAAQSIQGTLMLCNAVGPAVEKNFGMFFMEYELALSELGPTEVFTFPSLKDDDKDRSSSSSGKDEVIGESPVLISKNPLTESIHIPKSALSSFLLGHK